jgi:hypothetical protein
VVVEKELNTWKWTMDDIINAITEAAQLDTVTWLTWNGEISAAIVPPGRVRKESQQAVPEDKMKLIQGMLGPEDVKREVKIEMTCKVDYLDDDNGYTYVSVSRVKVTHSDGHDSVTEWRFAEPLPSLRMENF